MLEYCNQSVTSIEIFEICSRIAWKELNIKLETSELKRGKQLECCNEKRKHARSARVMCEPIEALLQAAQPRISLS